MKFDWLDYFKLAKSLVEAASDSSDADLVEAKLRCAISRAYYAAYCKARNYLRDIDGDGKLRNPKGLDGAHTYVINAFRYARNDKKRAGIGGNLLRLFENRKRADYEDKFVILVKDAKYSLSLAQDIIETLDKLD